MDPKIPGYGIPPVSKLQITPGDGLERDWGIGISQAAIMLVIACNHQEALAGWIEMGGELRLTARGASSGSMVPVCQTSPRTGQSKEINDLAGHGLPAKTHSLSCFAMQTTAWQRNSAACASCLGLNIGSPHIT